MIRRAGITPTILLMAGTHFIVDAYGNIFPPLLPVLVPSLHLSLAAAGTLAACFQLAASVAQLGFGPIADRWRPRVLLVVGPLVSVALLSLIGLPRNAVELGVLLLVGGLGAAAFHPPAAALVHRMSGPNKGTAMSVHITGGTLGQALAPLLFAPFVGRFGLGWTPVLAVPGLVVLGFALRHVPPIAREPHAHEGGGFRGLRPYAVPLTLLYSIVVLRTLTSAAFATFMPVMLTRRGLSVGQAGSVVAMYLFATGMGGFVGGPIADRFGARRVIVWSLLAAVPFLAVAPALSGWAFVLVVSVGGFLLQSTLPVNVTFGQSLAPISAATVSSLMMGFAWGSGSMSVPFVGMVADRIGIEPTLTAVALVPCVAALLAWPLPAGRHIAPHARPSDLGMPETA